MFSKWCFSEWCVQRVVRIRKGKRHHNASKHWSFQVLFVLLKKLSCVKAKVRNLKNTVWKTPFGILRGNHPKFEKKSSRSEKAILGATLGIPGSSRSNSRNGTHDLIQRRQKRTQPPPKEKLLGNFSENNSDHHHPPY